MKARARKVAGSLALFTVLTLSGPTFASSSALELVRIAREHERAHDEEVALRRYSEALGIDPTCEEAYLGLGSLRARRGDLRESDRVYSVALEHLPGSRAARSARAYVRRALGANAAAVDDLLASTEDETAALEVIARWHGEDGQTVAQLAWWRRIAAHPRTAENATRLRQAKTMVRALVIVVGTLDPAASPPELRGLRATLSTLAKRAQ